MARRQHWTENADRVWSGRLASHPIFGMLAEDDNGDWLVPLGNLDDGTPYWLGRFSARNPFHWLPWLRSRLTKRLAYVEATR